MNAHTPIEPAFEGPADEAAYDKWFREKVARSLADQRPSVPHETAVERAREIIEAARRK